MTLSKTGETFCNLAGALRQADHDVAYHARELDAAHQRYDGIARDMRNIIAAQPGQHVHWSGKRYSIDRGELQVEDEVGATELRDPEPEPEGEPTPRSNTVNWLIKAIMREEEATAGHPCPKCGSPRTRPAREIDGLREFRCGHCTHLFTVDPCRCGQPATEIVPTLRGESERVCSGCADAPRLEQSPC